MGQHMLDWGLWRYLIAISMSEGQITEAGGTLYCVIGLISPRIDEETDTRLLIWISLNENTTLGSSLLYS